MAVHWPHPWNHSLLAPRPAGCTHLLHSRPPAKTALCPHTAASLDRQEGHGAHRAAGPTPSLQPSDPQTSGLGFAREPQREAQKAKHPCRWPQTPRPPPGQSGASMPEPPQAAIAISPTHTPAQKTGTQGVPENSGTGRAKGRTTQPWRSAPMGSANPTHRGLPSLPTPSIPTRSW